MRAPKLHRATFKLIAASLAASRPTEDSAMPTWLNTCRNMAEALRPTNPQFNRETFLKACGYYGTEPDGDY